MIVEQILEGHMEMNNYLKKYWRFGVLLLVILVSGCITSAQDIAAKDCSGLENMEKLDCLYGKATYQSLLGDYNNALSTCKDMISGLNRKTVVLDAVVTANIRSYYNNCITTIALESLDTEVCEEAITETASEFLITTLGLERTEIDECKSKVEAKKKEIEFVGNIWGRVLTP